MNPTNQRGQILGAKGLRTRQRLVEVTRSLVDSAAMSEITSIRIARECGVSIATFYLYFEDVPDAILAVIEAVAASAPDFESEFQAPWIGPAGLKEAQAFVGRYVGFFHEHRAVLRVRNLLAGEKDGRVRQARMHHSLPAIRLLMRQLAGGQPVAEGAPAFKRLAAMAGMLLGMLERLCDVMGDKPVPPANNAIIGSWDRTELVNSTARILVATVATTMWEV